jgi:hypothetical protein
MNNSVSIYCDESSHLESLKNSTIMGLGAVTCQTARKDEAFTAIRAIKIKHGLAKNFEIKWSKVSISKIDFYLELLNFYFDSDYLGFRCVIIDKIKLEHKNFDTSHDEFYYKMLFLLIRELLHTESSYKIFLDKKDTNGKRKIDKLHEFLCNKNYDYKKEIVKSIQEVVSHQIELLQICDLLLGAVCYQNRGLTTNSGKIALLNLIKARTGYSLIKNTLPSEHKMNTLIWESKRLLDNV